MYVITGASGNTGKVIANALLDAGKEVRVLGRDAEKVKDLTDKGAEAAIGNLDDVDFLTNALTGATAVYAMIPPNFVTDNYRGYQNQVADAQIEAAAKFSTCSVRVTSRTTKSPGFMARSLENRI